MKKKIIVLIGFLTFFTIPICSQESEEERKFLEEQLLENEDDIFDLEITRGPAERSLILTKIADDAQEYIADPLYLKTYGVLSRPILDFPNISQNFSLEKQSFFKTSFFYNKTNCKKFTQTSEQISSYIDLADRTIFSFIGDNFTNLLKGLSVGKIEERRAGLVLEGQKKGKQWYLGIKAPVYYLERNFYFTEAEKAFLASNPILDSFGSSSGQDLGTFAKEHLISDKFGLGDIRLNAGWNLREKRTFNWALGCQLTIPTAFAIGNGVIGSSFRKNYYRPNHDIPTIFERYFEYDRNKNKDAEEAQKSLEQYNTLRNSFLTDFLDRLALTTIDSNLGNNKHFSLGFFNQFILKKFGCMTLQNNSSIEITIPNKQKRFFVLDQNADTFITDLSDIEAGLAFYNTKILEKFFPEALNTVVWPGVTFQSNILFDCTWKRLNLTLGADAWLRTREFLWGLEQKSEITSRAQIENASRPTSYQIKTLGALQYQTESGSKWRLYTDYTFVDSGIGKDYMIMLEYKIDL